MNQNHYTLLKKREGGHLPSSLHFTKRFNGSRGLAERLTIQHKLKAHHGCVNTVSFTPCGQHLLSGSDDQTIILWDWARATQLQKFKSGHQGNVFQARLMAQETDLVSCAADGEVRLAVRGSDGTFGHSRLIGHHEARAHKLSLCLPSEATSDRQLLSCGEDGVVNFYDLRSPTPSRQLFVCSPLQKPATSSFGSVRRSRLARGEVPMNSIQVQPDNGLQFVVGGADEFVRIYDLRSPVVATENGTMRDKVLRAFAPSHLAKGQSGSTHITCAVYSHDGSQIVASYNDELIYLFNSNDEPKSCEATVNSSSSECNTSKDSNLDAESSLEDLTNRKEHEGVEGVCTKVVQVYEGHRNSDTVKGVNFMGHNSEFVVSGSDCGHVFLWEKNTGRLVNMMKGDHHVVNCLEPHPDIFVLATSGIETDVKIWSPTSPDVTFSEIKAKSITAKNEKNRQNSINRFTTVAPFDMMQFLLRAQGRSGGEVLDSDGEDDDVDDDDDDDNGAIQCRPS